jgi:hypothetical protein
VKKLTKEKLVGKKGNEDEIKIDSINHSSTQSISIQQGAKAVAKSQ